MALKTTAIARQWLSRDHVGTPTDTNATTVQQQRNGVFCEVRTEILYGVNYSVNGVSRLVSE
jgi:hypothetical protein